MIAKRLKVTQILEATGGGTRRHLRDLVSNLDRDRFELSVICSLGREEDFAGEVDWMSGELGIHVRVIPMPSGVAPMADLLAIRPVRAALKELDPDIVHTHSSKAGLVGRLAAGKSAVRVIHTPHCWSFELQAPFVLRRVAVMVERWLARRTNLIVCVCHHEKRIALGHRITSSDKLRVIPNGIDPRPVLPATGSDLPGALQEIERIRHEKRVLTVAIVARICRQKGFPEAVSALAPILRNRENIRLVVIGDGPLRRETEQLCQALAVEQRVAFTGWVGNPRKLYGLIDVVVLPSLWEALPYSLLDAMAEGKAIVATDVGGVRETLAEGGGLCVPPGDARALAEAVSGLLVDGSRRSELGTKAVRTVQNFTLGQMIMTMEKVYAGALEVAKSR